MGKRRIVNTEYVDNNKMFIEYKRKLTHFYVNKYFDIFMSLFKIDGLTFQANDFCMLRFWDVGGITSFQAVGLKDVYFSTFTMELVDTYGFPKTINVINKYNASFYPKGSQTVDKDVVICYLRPDRKPIKELVNLMIERIVNVEMVINTNLITHKMPFVVGVSPEDQAKAQDLLTRILNDDPVVFTSIKDLQLVKTLVTSTPYIIDKLHQHRIVLENELLTILGIDNVQGVQASKERLLVDEVNANNAVINLNYRMMYDSLNEFITKTNKLFGSNFKVIPRIMPVNSVYDASEKKEGDNV